MLCLNPCVRNATQFAHLIYRESGMFAPGKGFLEIGAGGGDGESFIRLSELSFQAVRRRAWRVGGTWRTYGARLSHSLAS